MPAYCLITVQSLYIPVAIFVYKGFYVVFLGVVQVLAEVSEFGQERQRCERKALEYDDVSRHSLYVAETHRQFVGDMV